MRIVGVCVALFTLLLLGGCADSDSSSSDGGNTDAAVTGESLTLSSSLASGELLAKQGTISIYANVTNSEGQSVADGTSAYFVASSGSITSKASTIGGRALATYTATSQGGNVTINAYESLVAGTYGGLTDEYFLTVAAGPAVQIFTVSITPEQLGLRGSGENEVGTFVFSVTDAAGGPVQDGQVVTFTLDAPTGGAEFISDSSATTVDGQVIISLVSGTVPGVATVTASTESELGTIVTEARITMGNSQPDQLHLGFGAERLNVPGLVCVGIENNITAYVADRYSNPVPAGTPVYFAGECGVVALTDAGEVVTNTTNGFGQATATAITAEPTAELCRYVYWTEGQEAYTDSNANGMYDDGEPHQDIGEPYIDADDSGSYSSDEIFFDLDEDGSYTGADDVWQEDTFVWTDMNIRWSSYIADPAVNPNSFSIAAGGSQQFTFTVADVNGNPLPSGTTVKVTTTCDGVTLSEDAEATLPDAVNNETNFTVSAFAAADADAGSCSMTFEVTGTECNGFGSTTVSGAIR